MLNEQRGWWPVALSADLGAQPLGVRLLDQPVVLWRHASGQAVAMADRCPHRGAQLSLGRVLGEVIQCPYHGWTFEPSGACRAYPSQPGFTPGATSAACAYQAQEHEGLVWVQLQPARPRLTTQRRPHLPCPTSAVCPGAA
jgi:phenylpropionate dioxygenase-like ring-hydroxylating dioxygenase large terminal subunit